MRYFIIATLLFVFSLCLILLDERDKMQSINVKSFCDSISQLNYEYENRLNRFEITLEILKQENPKLASEFEEIMTTQTE
jgi:hypothetical protein